MTGNSTSAGQEAPLIESDATVSDKPCVPYRYLLTLLVFVATFTANAMRYNFNIALVAMVNFTAMNDGHNSTSEACPGEVVTKNSTKQGDFDWDARTQGELLAGFFYGYVITQIPGGYLSEIFGAKIVMGLAVFLSGVLSLLTPLVARWSAQALLVLRIIMGIIQGPFIPSIIGLYGHWAPRYERSKLLVWGAIGANFALLISPTVTGYLCDVDVLGGWPLSFYLFGGLSVVWFLFWMIFAHDNPSKHPRLSNYERQYLEINNPASSYMNENRNMKRPWLDILTSKPVWAVCIFSLFDGIGWYTLGSEVPIYMKQILKMDMSSIGFLSAAPYLGAFLVGLVTGPAVDTLIKNRILSTTNARKLATFIGEFSQCVCVLGMAFVACNKVAAVSLLILSQTLGSVGTAGAFINHIDIAPMYAGTLMGLSNFFSNIGGFVSPVMMSAITHNSTNRSSWQNMFYITSAIFAAATMVYMIFGSGEEQLWAKGSNKRQMEINVDEDTEQDTSG